MGDIDAGLIVQILIAVATLAAAWGVIQTKIAGIEKAVAAIEVSVEKIEKEIWSSIYELRTQHKEQGARLYSRCEVSENSLTSLTTRLNTIEAWAQPTEILRRAEERARFEADILARLKDAEFHLRAYSDRIYGLRASGGPASRRKAA